MQSCTEVIYIHKICVEKSSSSLLSSVHVTNGDAQPANHGAGKIPCSAPAPATLGRSNFLSTSPPSSPPITNHTHHRAHPSASAPASISTMPALASTTRAIARSWTQHTLPVARAGCTAMQTRNVSGSEAPSSSFDSPFKGVGSTTKIPSFGHYRNKSKSEEGPRLIQYFMVGTMGALASMGAKATVQGKNPTTSSVEACNTIQRGFGRSKMTSESNWLFCGWIAPAA